jgi:hypothetical protein
MSDIVFDAADKQSAPPLAADPTNVATAPGLLMAVVAVVSLVICLGGFATRQVGVGVGAASVALLAAGGTLSWLTAQGRRVRDTQRIAG